MLLLIARRLSAANHSESAGRAARLCDAPSSPWNSYENRVGAPDALIISSRTEAAAKHNRKRGKYLFLLAAPATRFGYGTRFARYSRAYRY